MLIYSFSIHVEIVKLVQLYCFTAIQLSYFTTLRLYGFTAFPLNDQGRWEDFEKEVSNTSDANWIPSEHIPWLVLELEMNITIREVQVDVARHMIDPSRSDGKDSQVKNIVMQMNMGEGKTSIIIPMLALSCCSSTSSLVQIIVLKALLIMNYQLLRSKLGGLLNRRISMHHKSIKSFNVFNND